MTFFVGMRGFEPPISRPPDAHFAGLSYIPNFFNVANLMNIYQLSSNIHDKNVIKECFTGLYKVDKTFVSIGFSSWYQNP
jgi:hypothetical protein